VVATSNSDEPKWLRLARSELRAHVREVPGPQHNPRVLWYHQHTRLKATSDEVPWCAAFVCAMLEEAGVRSTRSAAASSFAEWGEPSELVDGAVVVFGKADPDAGGSGHVAFLVGVEGDSVLVLGGNQGNAVSIAKRPRARVVAVRWPAAV
jgi:uncharacterized protein (TIGR02594 family)